ncbi:hypothetical protein [Arthrobacter sp. U41]|nr:hypothetical protein [Arthrobacter sp. U41]
MAKSPSGESLISRVMRLMSAFDRVLKAWARVPAACDSRQR